MRIDLQQMQLFFVAFLMDGGEEHTATLYAHHSSRREICYCDKRFAHKLFGLIKRVYTA